MMKAAIYAVLCFIFIVASHGQVKVNMRKNCPDGFTLGGVCGISGKSACISSYKNKKKSDCSCGDVDGIGTCCC
uniref:SP11-A14 protein n=1 Tax=Brassica napus TaxID=3708 RepID=Q8VX15_BRANA|nr:SP11-A14 protein [Brassica napus]